MGRFRERIREYKMGTETETKTLDEKRDEEGVRRAGRYFLYDEYSQKRRQHASRRIRLRDMTVDFTVLLNHFSVLLISRIRLKSCLGSLILLLLKLGGSFMR